jgi:glutamine synthetase
LANNINQFKEAAQLAASRSEMFLSFDAKPLAGQCGSSLHIHYSTELFDPWGLKANNGVVTPKRDNDNDYVLWAIGGMLEKMPDDINIFVPTAESKLRIEPWLNAPTKICWGRNNRSTAIRIPDGKPKRIEHRVSGADADPLKAISAIIAAAEYGINNKVQPDEPIFGNAWEAKYERAPLLAS